MSTLNSTPVDTIIERLYADAEQGSRGGGRGRGSGGGRAGRRALRPDGDSDRPVRDSREYWTAARHRHLAVSRETGRLLYLLTRSRRAQVIVEFGASFGVSTLHLAAGLRDSGGRRLITTEYEANKVAATRSVLIEAGLADLVDVREGEALHTLASDLPAPIDLVFLDGAKGMYLDVLTLLKSQLAPAAIVVADNADAGDAAHYREFVRNDPAWISTSTGDRIEISVLAG